MCLALRDQPGDPTREHAGLSGAGAGDHQQRGTGMHHGGALRLVEPGEELVGIGGTTRGGGRLVVA